MERLYGSSKKLGDDLKLGRDSKQNSAKNIMLFPPPEPNVMLSSEVTSSVISKSDTDRSGLSDRIKTLQFKARGILKGRPPSRDKYLKNHAKPNVGLIDTIR